MKASQAKVVRKSKKEKRSEADERHSPGRDLLGFVLLALSVFQIISLASYHPGDPSWNTSIQGEGVTIQNYGGIVGSHLSDFLLQVFGYAAYLVPLALIGVVWAIVFQASWSGMYARVGGFFVLLLSSTLFLSLAEQESGANPSWGGAVGLLLRSYLLEYIGLMGTYVVAVTACLIALVFTARLTIERFLKGIRWIGGVPHLLFRQARERFSSVVTSLKSALEAEEQQIRSGFDQIRSTQGPVIPNEKIRIGRTDREETKKERIAPTASEIPIVTKDSKMNDPAQMPQFHTLPAGQESTEAPTKGMSKGRSYRLPSNELLESPENQEISFNRDELFANAQILEQKLKDFGVFGNVVEVQPGPVVTMYEFEPAPGVKVNQLTRLNDDLALALKALSVRIEPIPGKAVIGIEVSNRQRQVVYLKEILTDEHFSKSQSKLTMALGKDISGASVTADLRKMPHLLVAGSTGSGKSVAVNSMILSFLYKATPDQVRMILVDPKMLELSLYDEIPHLLLPVVTDPRKSAAALRWAVNEMERRYRLMAELGVRNIEGYNRKIPRFLKENKNKRKLEKENELPLSADSCSATPSKEGRPGEEHSGSLPLIVIVIDELADLMMVSSREVEESIIRLAQMARAAGIHLILATQRPSVDVITGVIKANMPARISFKVASKTDSRTILDANSAELLLGAGDMLYLAPGTSKLKRIHGSFVSDNEVKRVTDFWKQQGDPEYNLEILRVQEQAMQKAKEGSEDDEMYQKALEIVRTQGVASISMIQRRLRIGYNRAARLVERMEEEGYLAPGEAGKPREVIMSRLMDGGGPI